MAADQRRKMSGKSSIGQLRVPIAKAWQRVQREVSEGAFLS